ncbi:hypothetical protein SOVF_103850 [Spinacia oleracea]|nr:hypothetical protein SOVF_103850 [Spinacia oleracea]
MDSLWRWKDITSLRNAYHGNAAGTMGATAQCNWKFNVTQYFSDRRFSSYDKEQIDEVRTLWVRYVVQQLYDN